LLYYERLRESTKRRLYRRVAYAIHYSSTSVTEAMNMPISELNAINEALAEIIEEENKTD
jgi:uncharacterized protein (DUF2342 family)